MATFTSTSTDMPLYRLDVHTYDRLAAAGALEGMDVELLDGLLVDKDSTRADPIHRIDVGTFNRMVASGAFEEERIELLEGLLVEVSQQSPEHAAMIEELTHHLARAQARLRVQLPLEAEWDSLPEPDLALAAQRSDPHRHSHTMLLAVEVAVSSHSRDRRTKARMYAHAGVPTYWIVDVPGRAVEVRTDPGPDGYAHCETYREGALVPSPLAGVVELDVTALFANV